MHFFHFVINLRRMSLCIHFLWRPKFFSVLIWFLVRKKVLIFDIHFATLLLEFMSHFLRVVARENNIRNFSNATFLTLSFFL